eukprot:764240-Hanusia_phi.AAC.10
MDYNSGERKGLQHSSLRVVEYWVGKAAQTETHVDSASSYSAKQVLEAREGPSEQRPGHIITNEALQWNIKTNDKFETPGGGSVLPPTTPKAPCFECHTQALSETLHPTQHMSKRFTDESKRDD